MSFIIGMVIGGLIVTLIPAQYTSPLREVIITQWQKVTKKG